MQNHPSLRVHNPNHTHSLASFQWSGLSDQQALQLTESCLQMQKWCSYKARGVVSEPICGNKARNGPATANQGSSLASQGSCHACGRHPGVNPPTSPYPTNLSKRIAPTSLILCYTAATWLKLLLQLHCDSVTVSPCDSMTV